MNANGSFDAVTVTLNPAIDLTVTLDRLVVGEVQRASSAVANCGGKGVNVAGCLADWGVRVAATGVLGRGNDGAFAEFFRERNTVELFPGALPALQELRATYELYALSNGNADIRRVGLDHLFSRHFSAISVGAAKPDPRIYRAALEAAGVQPQEVIHVGDHPEQDVAAAAGVGMRTVWVNFQGQPWPDLPPADGEIRAFAELLPLVRRLDGR